MLKTNQIGTIKKYMVTEKKTIIALAKELKVNRGYLSMVLNGTMSNADIEEKVLNWYKNTKQNNRVKRKGKVWKL